LLGLCSGIPQHDPASAARITWRGRNRCAPHAGVIDADDEAGFPDGGGDALGAPVRDTSDDLGVFPAL
jgi:hypothetical protein